MSQAEVLPGLLETPPVVSDFSIHGDAAALFAALAKAAGEFKPIARTRENTFYKSRYADLSDVIDATRPALAANGLVLLQPMSRRGDTWTVRTILAHSSGARMECEAHMPGTGDWQKLGSAVTYCRRYSASAILGVASEDDDDGNATKREEPQQESRGPRAGTRPTPPPVERKQVEQSKPAQTQLRVAPPPKPEEPKEEAPKEAPKAEEPAAEPERPASVPPPANDTAPAEDEVVAKGSPMHLELRALLQELGFTDPKMTESWCLALVGKAPQQVTLRRDFETLIADLKGRKSA